LPSLAIESLRALDIASPLGSQRFPPFPDTCLTVMSDNSKRTRSQLILSEEFGDVHFGISPLRAAKQERRRILQTDLPAGFSDASTPSNVGVGGDESDDELLLSPSKTRPPKRQSLSEQPGFPPEADYERQCKRLKQDHNGGGYLECR
jgi:hypothetical protein